MTNGMRYGASYRQPTLAALLPPGTAALPEDFPRRLDRIKTASGLSWRVLGEKLGVDPRQLARWRKGVEPKGGAMLSLMEFSMVLPEGAGLLLGRRSQRPDRMPATKMNGL